MTTEITFGQTQADLVNSIAARIMSGDTSSLEHIIELLFQYHSAAVFWQTFNTERTQADTKHESVIDDKTKVEALSREAEFKIKDVLTRLREVRDSTGQIDQCIHILATLLPR